ncbi:MAG: hypothetical protein AAFR29_00105, partial [Pseudomonadota bacterium]
RKQQRAVPVTGVASHGHCALLFSAFWFPDPAFTGALTGLATGHPIVAYARQWIPNTNNARIDTQLSVHE